MFNKFSIPTTKKKKKKLFLLTKLGTTFRFRRVIYVPHQYHLEELLRVPYELFGQPIP